MDVDTYLKVTNNDKRNDNKKNNIWSIINIWIYYRIWIMRIHALSRSITIGGNDGNNNN